MSPGLRSGLLAITLLFALSVRAAPRCSLHRPSGIQPCVRKLLLSVRPALRKQLDSQKLPDISGEVFGAPWKVTEVLVSGAADFRVAKVKVRPLSRRNVTHFNVRFQIRWPKLAVGMNGVVRVCDEFIQLGRCVDIQGRANLKVKRALAKVSTTMNLDELRTGGLNVSAEEAKIGVLFSGVDSMTKLDNTGGIELAQFWVKATLLTRDLLLRLWEKQKPALTTMITNQLRQLVTSYLPAKLRESVRRAPPPGRGNKARSSPRAKGRPPRTQTRRSNLRRASFAPLLEGDSFASSRTETHFTTKIL